VEVGDGFSTIEALFTKEAVNNFRKLHSHLKLSNLQGKLIKVQKWSLKLKQRVSKEVLNSTSNLGIYLCIHEFSPKTEYVA